MVKIAHFVMMIPPLKNFEDKHLDKMPLFRSIIIQIHAKKLQKIKNIKNKEYGK